MSVWIGNSSNQNQALFVRVGAGAQVVPTIVPGGQIEITSDTIAWGIIGGGYGPPIIAAAAAPDGYAGLMYSPDPIPADQVFPPGWITANGPPPAQTITSWPTS